VPPNVIDKAGTRLPLALGVLEKFEAFPATKRNVQFICNCLSKCVLYPHHAEGQFNPNPMDKKRLLNLDTPEQGGPKRHTSAYIAYLLIRAIKYEITAIKIEIPLSHLFSYQEGYAF
jgi:hypothetical protein